MGRGFSGQTLIKPKLTLARHPLWLVGFRPFFSLACLPGLGLPGLWVLIFLGEIPAPPASFAAV